jgi:hypothetical protein
MNIGSGMLPANKQTLGRQTSRFSTIFKKEVAKIPPDAPNFLTQSYIAFRTALKKDTYAFHPGTGATGTNIPKLRFTRQA